MDEVSADTLSPGAIAKELGLSDAKVKKAIKELALEPARRKGVCCFYSRDAVERIRTAIAG
jgi:hypothetical protein